MIVLDLSGEIRSGVVALFSPAFCIYTGICYAYCSICRCLWRSSCEGPPNLAVFRNCVCLKRLLGESSSAYVASNFTVSFMLSGTLPSSKDVTLADGRCYPVAATAAFVGYALAATN